MTDTYRALAAPRKLLVPDRALVLAKCGWNGDPATELNDDQVSMLWEFMLALGEVAAVGVGVGKSLASFLFPNMVEVERPLIIVRSRLVRNLWREYEKWKNVYHIPDFSVMTYEDLSDKNQLSRLLNMAPGSVVLDEAHRMKIQTSARWFQFIQFLKNNLKSRIVVMSGTLTTKNTNDYSHLIEAALRDESPVPHHDTLAAKAWARSFGDIPDPEPYDYMHTKPLVAQYPNSEKSYTDQCRQALFQHLNTTAGVVISNKLSCNASITATKIKTPTLPTFVRDLMNTATKDLKDPDGIGISTVEADQLIRQLQYGFWYRKDWGDTPRDVIDQWRLSVSRWNRVVAAYLQDPEENITSPALFEEAVRAGKFPEVRRDLEDLDAVTGWYKKETVWIWQGWFEDQLRWFEKSKEPGIGWYTKTTALNPRWKAEGIPFYAADSIIDEDKPHTCAMSIHSMKEGFNLQNWRHMRYMQIPRDPGVWQQSMARIHRQGFDGDDLPVEVVVHTELLTKTLDSAIQGARYVEKTLQDKQRLLLATWT